MSSTGSLLDEQNPPGARAKKVAEARGISLPQNLSLPHVDLFLSTLLALTAFIPRLMLARQIDVSTDEPIYIIAGTRYITLIQSANFTSVRWLYNNEHPAFAKLLIGLFVNVLTKLALTHSLVAARLPSVLLSTALIVAVYLLARAPLGRTIALVAAGGLAFSPWFAYFNSEALLDTTMVVLITLAYLLLWSAIRHPRRYILIGILIGLAGASKYPAALVLPSFLAFIGYYYGFLRRSLPEDQRPSLPWRWWIIGACLIPISFFIADPSIWLDPLPRLLTSLGSSLGHAESGHVTFWAGQVYEHVPPWMILYVIFGKVSSFITLPALGFLIFACVRLVRFHWPAGQKSSDAYIHTDETIHDIASTAFLFFWLLLSLVFYSQLTILVGTHYYLPVITPLFLAGATGLMLAGRFLFKRFSTARALPEQSMSTGQTQFPWSKGLLFALLFPALVGPNVIGLLTTPDADGYTSEFFGGENTTLEVMYTGYHEADDWIMAHSKTGGKIGIVGGSATVLWTIFNSTQTGNFQFSVTTYGQASYAFDYLVWPMDLIQRTWRPPSPWNAHVVHMVMGGGTIYCLIMARDPSSLTT